MSRPVLVDTDTAVDDALALLLVADAPELDVRDVTVVAGNVPFDRQVANAKYALSVAGVADDVTVYEGAREPLDKGHETAENVHGEGGLGGDLRPDPDLPSGDEHAADRIVSAAREEQNLELLCLGPLTNVALALERDPDLPDLVERVWVMGGACRCGGTITPSAEFNVWVDPDAASQVFEAFDVTLVPWDVCQETPIRPSVVSEVTDAAPEHDPAEFFEEIREPFAPLVSEVYGIEGDVLADPLTAAVCIDPELAETERYDVAVDTREGLTRGHTSVDVYGIGDRGSPVRVVTDADRGGFEEQFAATFTP